MLSCLTEGPLEVFELAARLPEFSHQTVLKLVRDGHARGRLHAKPPAELLAGTTKPESASHV
ncbi:hypothetical protein GXW82_08770 [Streptacidiphilus sp. 4-A2]|nr:hypothetical protein [Streptacidiphilus sp. 4-A2]